MLDVRCFLQGNNFAGLASTVLDTLSVSANNLVAETAGTDGLRMTIRIATGYFSGSFKYRMNPATPLTLRTVPFSGVMFQKQNLGAGVFLGWDASGSLNLSPQ